MPPIPDADPSLAPNFDLAPNQKLPDAGPMQEMGLTGLKRVSGYVEEEFLPALRGRDAVRVFREMGHNDSTAGALLFVIETLLSETKWDVEGASDDGQNAPVGSDEWNAWFLKSCMNDMNQPWSAFIVEVCSMFQYGYSWFEHVFKKRVGPWENDGAKRSQYTDGFIGIRKLAIRAQETQWRWVFDESGGIKGFVQMAPPTYKQVTIPIERSLLFRTRYNKGNPEGWAESVDNLIWTIDGLKKFGDLTEGDYVYGSNGMPTRVVATRRWSMRPRYRVTLDSGELGVYDENHQWPAFSTRQLATGRTPSHGLSTTAELAIQVERSDAVNRRTKLPVMPAVTGMEDDSLPMSPWALGYWLGNGAKGGQQVTCHLDDAEWVAGMFARCGFDCSARRVNDTNAAVLTVHGLKAALRKAGVLDEKFVPDVYLRADEMHRRELLAGLLDSDGHGDRHGRVEFGNTDKGLIDAVATLVRSLGMKAFVTLRKESHCSVIRDRDVLGGRLWNVKFTPHDQVFLMPRKGRHISDDHKRTKVHTITKVERVEDGDTMCIQVDAEDGIYLTGDQMAPTHNSMLRRAYRDWHILKRIQEIQAVGMERDLAGMPVGKLPASYLNAKQGTIQAQTRDAFRKMVRGVRRDENEGILIPSDTDPDTKLPLFDFELMSAGGSRQFDIEGTIQRLQASILRTVMADFLVLGTGGADSTGSYAMHTDKSGLFRTAINSFSQSIADVLNRYLVPRLFAINGIKPPTLPKITVANIDPPDLTQLASLITSTAGAGMTWFPNPTLEKFILDIAGLPEMPEEQADHEEQMFSMKQITDEANAQMQLLGLKQQAESMAQGVPAQQASQGMTPDDYQAQQAQTQMGVAGQAQQLQQQAQQPPGGDQGQGGQSGQEKPQGDPKAPQQIDREKVKQAQTDTKIKQARLQQLKQSPAQRAGRNRGDN